MAAQILSKDNQNTHKRNTDVDLTPMVDLGFLLITFFIFTTSMNTPKALQYYTPKQDTQDSSETKASTVITCILDDDDKVYFYTGAGDASNLKTIKVADFDNNSNSIRTALQDFQKQVEYKVSQGILSPDDRSMVIIKPTEFATFQNLVDIMDEAVIAGIQTQCTLNPSELEENYIHSMK